MIKGWTITICTTIFALAGTWKEPFLALVALVPIAVLWILDSTYLANERCFVSLYTAAIQDYSLKVKNEKLQKEHQEKTENGKVQPEKEVEINSAEYSMNFVPFKKIARNNWQVVFCSSTIKWFYIMLTAFSVILFFGLLFINKSAKNEPFYFSTKLKIDRLLIRTDMPEFIINNNLLNDTITKTFKINNGKENIYILQIQRSKRVAR